MTSARIALLAAVIGGLLLAHFATRTPAPVPGSAPASVFSAERALDDVRAIARAPHPTGSPENARVRDYLLARLRSLGLEATVQRAGGIDNVIGVLPGRDRRLPAVVLMSHYDSVPASPGAADDAAGVAAGLEVVRALTERGRPLRDVVLLFTDAEEVGLDGAQAFWGEGGPAHPLAARAGVVLNAEARGGGGRALMFETGPRSSGLVGAFARTAPAPASNSLATFVYERLPNDTDFTIAKRAGVPGLNFAFLGRPEQYHQPGSTPEALDAGSLQHLGDQLLALTQPLAEASRPLSVGADPVYSDLLGLKLLSYPAWGGWLLLALALALAAWAWRKPPPARDVFWGFAAALGLLVGLGLVYFLISIPLSGMGYYAALAALRGTEIGLLAAAVAVLSAVFLPLARRQGGGVSGVWLGFILLGLLLAAAAQALAPPTAFLLTWPVLAATIAAALTGGAPDGRAMLALVAGVAAVGIGQVGEWAHYIALGLGYFRPEPLALLALLAAIPLTPLLLLSLRRPARV